MPRKTRPALDRFMEKVEPRDGCWLWTGAVSGGRHPDDPKYGYFRVDRMTVRVHRWIYEQKIGAIPVGMTIHHTCNETRCVNPDHLAIADNATNIREMIGRRRPKGSRRVIPATDDHRRWTPAQRFAEKYVVDPSGCWLWIGAKNSGGYGAFWTEGTQTTAQRASYKLFVGEIADNLEIDHLCRNRACVNPAHLEAVTRQENQLRGEGVSGRAARRTRCPQGHPLDGVRMNGGALGRYCKTCNRERYYRRRAMQNAPHAARD